MSSWNPYTDIPRGKKQSEGDEETKKIKITTTLSAEKKRNDLKKPHEKVTNAPLSPPVSEAWDNSQHTTVTKKVELNKHYSNRVYIFN